MALERKNEGFAETYAFIKERYPPFTLFLLRVFPIPPLDSWWILIRPPGHESTGIRADEPSTRHLLSIPIPGKFEP
jgi:hypothetical protein